MTFSKFIFILVQLILSPFLSANELDLKQQIEKELALRNQKSVLALSRKLEKTNKVQAHYFLAKGYLLLGNNGIVNYDSSLYFTRKVLVETVSSEELHFQAKLLKIQIYLENGDYKECISNIHDQLNSEVVQHSPEKEYIINIELFKLYTRISDLKSAGKMIPLIKNPPKKIDSLNLAKSYMALGKYYLNSGNIYFAKHYYKLSFKQFSENEIGNKVDAWHMLAELEKEEGNIDNAMKIYNEILKYETRNDYKHGFIHTLLIASETSLSNNREKSEMANYAIQAYKYAKRLNNKLRLIQAEMNMGYYYLQTEKEDSSIFHFNTALKLAEEIEEYYWSASASRFLVNIYKSKENFKKAFYYQQINNYANDRLLENNRNEEAEFIRNMHLMYTYKHEIELASLELEKKQTRLIFWIITSIGSLAIATLLFLLYIRQKRNNLFLTEKALKESASKIQPRLANIPDKKEDRSTDDPINLDLQNKLQNFIEEKGFLDPDCSLSSLAKELNTNTAYLSKYINEILKTSFNQWINEYRIHDFIERVKTDNEVRRTFTLDHLAKLSGFNSKSTFIRAFKKQTGIAPSVFLRNLEDIK